MYLANLRTVRCTGMLLALWNPVIMNGACVAQLLIVLELIRAMQGSQAQMNDCLRLFHFYVQHCWGTRCDVVHYRPNVQAPLFCYQLETSLRLPVVIKSILDDARKHHRSAQQMAAWIKVNLRGLWQRYAQDLERKCGSGTILFAKGDLIQLIKNAGGFEQQAPLWDSPHNLRRMAEMQVEVLAHRMQLGATTRLYGGLVTGQFATPGGIGTPGQPRKFYATLPQLTTLVLYADEDVDAMFFRHFKLGMARLELGQFIITMGGDVDMTKVG